MRNYTGEKPEHMRNCYADEEQEFTRNGIGEKPEHVRSYPGEGMECIRRYLDTICDIPRRIADRRPLVHMIPNSVTAALCTDGLSALGARPLMACAPEEMAEIVSCADAVVVNMGQPGEEKLRAARIALQTAGERKVPLILDPVGAGASRFRMEAFMSLLSMEWKGIVKGNRSETAALQSRLLSHQGIDSIGEFDLKLRAEDGRVWAVSGSTDVVFDDRKCIRIYHETGKKLMLTGSGCLTGAVMGACFAVEPDPVTAALAAFAVMAYAGEKAAVCSGYGSQKLELLNALTRIDRQEFSGWLEEMAGRRALCSGRSTPCI